MLEHLYCDHILPQLLHQVTPYSEYGVYGTQSIDNNGQRIKRCKMCKQFHPVKTHYYYVASREYYEAICKQCKNDQQSERKKLERKRKNEEEYKARTNGN